MIHVAIEEAGGEGSTDPNCDIHVYPDDTSTRTSSRTHVCTGNGNGGARRSI